MVHFGENTNHILFKNCSAYRFWHLYSKAVLGGMGEDFITHYATVSNDTKHVPIDISNGFLSIVYGKESRIFEVDPILNNLIYNTQNGINYRPCPFQSIFFNLSYKIDEFLEIKGIIVYDGLYLNNPIKELSIGYIICDYKDDGEFIGIIKIPPRKEEDQDTFYTTKADEKISKHLIKKIRLVIVNILDLINNNFEDIEKVSIRYDKTTNEKRIKKGKIWLANKIYIKPKQKLQEIAQEFNKGINKKYSHQFMVRGHFRNFKSVKYTKVVGSKKWIYPYWKGEGIKVKKQYKIKE